MSSKATEALTTIGIILHNLDAYQSATNFMNDGLNHPIAEIFDDIGMTDPSNAPNARFLYTIWYAPNSVPVQYMVTAEDKSNPVNRISIGRGVGPTAGEGIFSHLKF